MLLDFLINITDTFGFYSKFSASCASNVDVDREPVERRLQYPGSDIGADRQESRINILLILNLRNIVTQNMFIVGGCEFQI